MTTSMLEVLIVSSKYSKCPRDFCIMAHAVAHPVFWGAMFFRLIFLFNEISENGLGGPIDQVLGSPHHCSLFESILKPNPPFQYFIIRFGIKASQGGPHRLKERKIEKD